MADIDAVLERLVTDAAFRGRLASDPATALAGYDLTADDLQLLASSLDDADSGQRGVEQRTSKSAVLGLLASLTGGGGGTGDLQDRPLRLDGAAKDTAYLDEAAPGGETEGISGYVKIEDIKPDPSTPDVPSDEATEHRVPGKPKWGELTTARAAGDGSADGGSVDLGDAAPGGATEAAYTKFDHIKGESHAPDDDADAAGRGVSGGKKYTNLTLKRGADTNAEPGEQFAPAEPAEDPNLAFKQGWPRKWEGANAAPTDGDAPPAGTGESRDAEAWPTKWSGGEAADPTEAGDFDGDARTDLGSGAPTPATEQPKDFLTIEDA